MVGQQRKNHVAHLGGIAMSLRSRIDAVRRAESACAAQRQAIGTAWRGLKDETAHVATPQRVLVGGVVAGFIAGLSLPGSGKKAGGLIGNRLTSLFMDVLSSNVRAEFAAGAALAAAEESADRGPSTGGEP